MSKRKKPKQIKQPRREDDHHDARGLFAGVLLIIGLVCIAYLPAFVSGFIWDDPDYIINNHTLRDASGLVEMWTRPRSLPQWYPLVHTTYWIEFQMWGLNPAGYHVTNLLLHAINSILLWRLLVRLDIPGALLAACLFAVHPVHVESVAWVTERKNVLSLLFYLLAMRVYLDRVADSDAVKPRDYAIALALFALALFSKTVTSTLPAAVLVILWWKRGRLMARDFVRLAPFFAIGIGLGAFTGWLEHTHVGADGSKIAELNLDLVQRLFIAGRAVWFYAAKLLWPMNLAFIYPRWDSIDAKSPWLILFPLAAIGAAVALLLLMRRRIGRGPLAAALLFGGTLFPALGFVNVYPMRFSFVADHFQYHASAALIALFAAIVATHVPRQPRAALSAVLVLLLSVQTYRHARVFQSAEALWRDTLAKNPRSWMVHTNLAHALREKGDFDEAEDRYRDALRLAPNLHDTHTNIAMMHGYRGNFDDSIRELNEALRINPEFAPAHYTIGQIYARLDRLDDAERSLRRAIELAPQYAEAHYRLGVLLEQRGDREGAVEHYRAAVGSKPGFAEARYNLGTLLLSMKQLDEAIANLYAATQADPDYVEAWVNLGWAQQQYGYPSDAVASFRRALQLRPNFPPALAGLRAAQAAGGR